MNEDYLWNRSGEPDKEVARLEELLRPLGYGARTLKRERERSWLPAVAAALVIAFAGSLLLLPGPSADRWQVDGSHFVAPGQTISSGSLYARDIGQVDVMPGSLVRILGKRQLDLQRGTVRALIWAPPRQFVVDTPSARAVDLGCQYTLTVDAEGSGLVEVQTGWVAFEHAGLEAFIPAGAACRTSRSGLGVPWFQDAPEDLRKGVLEWNLNRSTSTLSTVLSAARPRDGLTLWHLLARVDSRERPVVLARFKQLVSVPHGHDSMDDYWAALGLQSTNWWRSWKQRW